MMSRTAAATAERAVSLVLSDSQAAGPNLSGLLEAVVAKAVVQPAGAGLPTHDLL
jgi:hypothetical protein